MEQTLTNFIRALRSAGMPVSTAEAIDATRTLALVGYSDRSALKTSLAPVLAKSLEETAIYDRLFELFFAPARAEEAAESSAGEEQGGGSPDPHGGADTEGAAAFLNLASGETRAAAGAIEAAANAVGADDIRFSTQISYFTQRILEELGVRDLEAALIRALTDRGSSGEGEAQALMAARETMRRRARAHMERRYDVYGRSATENFLNDVVLEKPMSALDRRDQVRAKQLIARIAKRLAVKHGRRRIIRNRGRMDVGATLRANAGHDGIPFNVVWRRKKKDRPKIVAICDVSGSVSQYVRFLLLFLFTLNETIRDIRCYAFSHLLKDVTGLLDDRGFEAAMADILRDLGAGSTDYGRALADFHSVHGRRVDKRTTIIVLGDGRTNETDPRLDLFRDLTARAKRTIWLCPEHPAGWGTGDSRMLDYKAYCDRVARCASIKDLEAAMADLLSAYG